MYTVKYHHFYLYFPPTDPIIVSLTHLPPNFVLSPFTPQPTQFSWGCQCEHRHRANPWSMRNLLVVILKKRVICENIFMVLNIFKKSCDFVNKSFRLCI